MLKVDFTNNRIFSFNGPNLCFLGNEDDFLQLAKSISDLTAIGVIKTLDIYSLEFVVKDGEDKGIVFASKTGSKSLGVFDDERLLFELDPRYWERLFKYFVFMSWKKSTYYLNEYENCLNDLGLIQECNFICSSEF